MCTCTPSLCLLALWHLNRCYITESAGGQTAIREAPPRDTTFTLPKLLERGGAGAHLLYKVALSLRAEVAAPAV